MSKLVTIKSKFSFDEWIFIVENDVIVWGQYCSTQYRKWQSSVYESDLLSDTSMIRNPDFFLITEEILDD